MFFNSEYLRYKQNMERMRAKVKERYLLFKIMRLFIIENIYEYVHQSRRYLGWSRLHSQALTLLARLLVTYNLPFRDVRCHAHATIEYFRVD